MIIASKILFHHSYGHLTIVLTWQILNLFFKFLLKGLDIPSSWGGAGKCENSGSGEYLIDSVCIEHFCETSACFLLF